MKLKSFQIKNYKSIVDTGEVTLSAHDNITVLAGQNESGKSSVLEALNDYEGSKFDPDSKPFTTKGALVQSVMCKYEVDDHSEFISTLTDLFVEDYEIVLADGEKLFDEKKIKNIKDFALTRSFADEKVSFSMDNTVFEIIRAAILEKEVETEEKKEDGTSEKKAAKEKILELEDTDIGDIADILWRTTPKIILFNDFCDLLPDRITLADLKTKNDKAKGYRAVKNLETILKVDFAGLYAKEDLEREAIRDEHNEKISVDFQKAWGQKIHNTNKVELKYDFEKRDTDDTSYVNFYIETKDRQKIKPRLRSKGLVWFLSFWLELNAQNSNEHKLVILADEPGLYLHVKAQGDILQLFKKLGSQGHRIIYTTHSPNLIESKYLNRINLVLNDPKAGTILESVTTSKIDNENKKDALQPIAHAIGLEVSDFSSLGKKNVILEGLSDFYYFLAMRKVLGRKDDYGFLPGIGVRKIESLISLCIGHGFDWLIIMDDDPVKGGADSLTKFDEIKNHVFDGDETQAKEKVHILPKTVGIENMFTFDDIKLVDLKVTSQKDLVKVVGKDRKILFGKLFFEKVEAGEITKTKLSKDTKDRFGKVFDFIEAKF